MDTAQLTQQVKAATEQARQWTTTGWSMKFGPYQTEVNTLEAAEKTPRTMHNRQEAIGYWQGIQYASEEAVAQGEKALGELGKGDVTAAMRSVYFAVFVEKKFNEKAPTWGPVLEALRQ